MVYRRKIVVKPSREKDEQPIGSLTMRKRERGRKREKGRQEKRSQQGGKERRKATTQCRWQLAHPTDPVSSLLFLAFRRLSSPWRQDNRGRCGVSVSCRTEIAQMETSVSFSLRPPVTRSCDCFLLLILLSFSFVIRFCFPFPSYRLLIHLLLFCSPQFRETRIATIFTVATNVYDLRVFNKYLRRYRSFVVITRYSFSMSVVPLCCF